MPYSDQQIKDYAATLEAKGAADSDIEEFVKTAKAEQANASSSAPINQMSPLSMALGGIALPGSPAYSPASVVDSAMRAGGPAAGQTIGALPALSVPTFGASVPIGGAIGGFAGDYAAQQRAISAGQQPEGYRMGQGLSSALTGAIPAFLGSFASSAAKYTASNLAAQELAKRVDQGKDLTPYDAAAIAATSAVGAKAMQLLGKAPTSLEDPLFKQRNAAFTAIRDKGVVVPPAELGKGMTALDSAAGPVALARDANQTNGRVLQQMAQEDLGVSKGNDLSLMPEDFNKVRVDAGKVYKQVAAISPGVADLVETLPMTRAVASASYDSFKAGKISFAEWQAAKQDFNAQKQLILKAAAKKSPALAKHLTEAETTIAKAYDYQRGTNPSTGLIDPQDMGSQAYDQVREGGKVKFTGNAEKIADFANAFPRLARAPEKVLPSGPNSLNQSLALMALSSEKPEGFLMAAKNFAAKPIRSALLSSPVQNQLAQPRMTSPSSDFLANFSRFLAMNAGQSQPDASRFLQPQGAQ